jgi:hypothetical protein
MPPKRPDRLHLIRMIIDMRRELESAARSDPFAATKKISSTVTVVTLG